MAVLVDTSVWIEYFRIGKITDRLDILINENLVATNELILAELIPFLKIRNQRRIIRLLQSLYKLELNINWTQIADYQYQCLKNGINGVGIPDLIIAQNAKQNRSEIYSLDRHFNLLQKILRIKVTG